MKKVLLLGGFIIFFLNSKSQDIKECDICKYKIAYNHLVYDSLLWENSMVQLNNSFVSDSIISINITFFRDEFKEENESEHECFMRISKKDKETWHKPIYSPSLSNIFHNRIDNPSFIIFFSEVEDNRLFCEIFPLNKYKIFSYDQNAYFNESYIYMFVFQDNDLINRIIKKKIAYN